MTEEQHARSYAATTPKLAESRQDVLFGDVFRGPSRRCESTPSGHEGVHLQWRGRGNRRRVSGRSAGVSYA
jgi:hypothetical protein